ncbi:MAG: hypothetical protein SNJ70_08490 [Armatimonadota bacterium]
MNTTLFVLIGSILAIINSFVLMSMMKCFNHRSDKILFFLISIVSFIVFSLLAAGALGKFGSFEMTTVQIFMLVIMIILKKTVIKTAEENNITHSEIIFSPYVVIAIIIIIYASIGLFKTALGAYPQEDSYNHHIPIAQWYIEHGSITKPEVGNEPLYPANISIIYAWLIMLKKTFILQGLFNAVLCIVCGLSIYSICRTLDMTKEVSLWAFALCLGNYLMFFEVRSLYIDASFASFVLIGTAFALKHLKESNLAFCIASGMAFGLALGSKPQGLIYAFVIFVVMLFASFVNYKQIRKISYSAKGLISWVLPMLFLGSYWYIRNAILSSSISQAPQEDVSTLTLIKNTAILWNIPEYISSFGIVKIIKSFSGQVSFVALFAFIPYLWSIIYTIKEKDSKQKTLQIWLWLISFSFLLFLIIHPFSARVYSGMPLNPDLAQLRYGLPFICIINIYWVMMLKNKPQWLPLLTLGLWLPASKLVAVVSLALAGIVCKNSRG